MYRMFEVFDVTSPAPKSHLPSCVQQTGINIRRDTSHAQIQIGTQFILIFGQVSQFDSPECIAIGCLLHYSWDRLLLIFSRIMATRQSSAIVRTRTLSRSQVRNSRGRGRKQNSSRNAVITRSIKRMRVKFLNVSMSCLRDLARLKIRQLVAPRDVMFVRAQVLRCF